MAITLTQDTYRLWARIGESVRTTPGNVLVTDSTANVLAQLAQLEALSIVAEGW
jgi:hypothetical protein